MAVQETSPGKESKWWKPWAWAAVAILGLALFL